MWIGEAIEGCSHTGKINKNCFVMRAKMHLQFLAARDTNKGETFWTVSFEELNDKQKGRFARLGFFPNKTLAQVVTTLQTVHFWVCVACSCPWGVS